MKYENIEVGLADGLAKITINREKSLNALNKDTLEELLFCFTELSQADTLSCVIITGKGEKAFIAGADISYMQDFGSLEGRTFGLLGHQTMSCIENFPTPVIAAVNGFALGGGCELALACDIRIASENARFGQPEVNLGVIPGFGGTQRLPRLVGKGVASELLFTGDIIDASEALRIGLVNRVVGLDKLMGECEKVAAKIGQKGPLAVKLCKQAVADGMEMDLKRACNYEAELFGACFGSMDQKEGMKAFLEKRRAVFQGK
ncbi:MAG: crotonase [Desulfobulbaceae bacterium]|nr:MAG: crotonase [Desulfobulbaceae bacterium]